jgi:hypothetical protein
MKGSEELLKLEKPKKKRGGKEGTRGIQRRLDEFLGDRR